MFSYQLGNFSERMIQKLIRFAEYSSCSPIWQALRNSSALFHRSDFDLSPPYRYPQPHRYGQYLGKQRPFALKVTFFGEF